MMASPVLVTMGDSAADEETRQPLLAEEEVAVQPGKGKLDQGVIAVFSRKGQQIYLGTPRVRLISIKTHEENTVRYISIPLFFTPPPFSFHFFHSFQLFNFHLFSLFCNPLN